MTPNQDEILARIGAFLWANDRPVPVVLVARRGCGAWSASSQAMRNGKCLQGCPRRRRRGGKEHDQETGRRHRTHGCCHSSFHSWTNRPISGERAWDLDCDSGG
jgi:hypothetical protein